jgi:hypothetical protein
VQARGHVVQLLNVRKAIFGLGFFLIAACSGSQEDSDSGSGSAAASAGEDSSSGGSGPSGGSGKGGGLGASAGDSATGGNESGGSDVGGAAPSGGTSSGSGGFGASVSGGTSGTAGSASGGDSGMATAGRAGGGTGGSDITDPVCDPSEGSLDNSPYPDCEPREPNDACELCIQANCCQESKVCYGFDPANVCGWGGPMPSPYDTVGEIDCYVRCARAYVEETGVYDDSAADLCVPACTTDGCGLIGNATQDLVVCMEASCEAPCFAP